MTAGSAANDSRIAELERAVERRDQQLLVREAKIRQLREELQATRASFARVRGARVYKTAMMMRRVSSVRHPRAVVAVLRRRLTRGR